MTAIRSAGAGDIARLCSHSPEWVAGIIHKKHVPLRHGSGGAE